MEPFLLPEGIITQDNLETASGLDAALVFGGDGTIHRYLAELHRHGLPVLVVPVGSGNDFARSLGLRNRETALRAWRRFCAGGNNVREIDLGVISGLTSTGLTDTKSVNTGLTNAGQIDAKAVNTGSLEIGPLNTGPIHEDGPQTFFCCVAGVGLDAGANARANRMPSWFRSTAGYLLAGVRELWSFKPLEFRLTTEAGGLSRTAFFAAVGNARSYGGGMKVVPGAQLDDGLLDVCLVGKMSKLKILFCLPTIFFGAHTSIRGIEYFQARRVRIETARPLALYADGELAGQTPLEISLIRRGLKVIVPA
ncbi:MAG: hypothetical protein LAP21_00730 [Acidobacteriia bacterium]|nr:hypothetical protein [Terriglobia bacterium]